MLARDRSRRLLAARAALLAVSLTAVTGCTGDPSPPADAPAAEPTPITAFDAATLTVAREEFCERVDPVAVEAAVGDVRGTSHYLNGEPARLAPGVRDVSHEFGCVFRGADGAVARAWVFVPPVTTDRAGDIVAELNGQDGCRSLPAPTFGDPATGSLCRGDGAGEASYAGLFVDAWFGCSLTRPEDTREELLDAAGSWCVAAVQGAAG